MATPRRNLAPAVRVPLDGEERVRIRVLKAFTATNGQEFQPGWLAGFPKDDAARLVAAKFAVDVEAEAKALKMAAAAAEAAMPKDSPHAEQGAAGDVAGADAAADDAAAQPNEATKKRKK